MKQVLTLVLLVSFVVGAAWADDPKALADLAVASETAAVAAPAAELEEPNPDIDQPAESFSAMLAGLDPANAARINRGEPGPECILECFNDFGWCLDNLCVPPDFDGFGSPLACKRQCRIDLQECKRNC
ncbi:MAG: hypothetical protein GY719_18270 [bacterium]|nr:hypothetical protein [bacterium]